MKSRIDRITHVVIGKSPDRDAELLLNELAINAGHIQTHHDLLGRIWGPEYCEDVQILRKWICRLRHKIETDCPHPKIISTVPKTGYIFNK
jgi:two-component system, OmpR family, KDP operon response regulator KdpE